MAKAAGLAQQSNLRYFPQLDPGRKIRFQNILFEKLSCLSDYQRDAMR